jgi:fumarate reductase subunit D
MRDRSKAKLLTNVVALVSCHHLVDGVLSAIQMDPVVNGAAHSWISKLVVTLLVILSSLQIADHSLSVGLNKNVMLEGAQGSG